MLNCSITSNLLQYHGREFTGLLHPWELPDKNTGVCCHLLLQGIIPDPGIEYMSFVSPVSQAGSFCAEPSETAQYIKSSEPEDFIYLGYK